MSSPEEWGDACEEKRHKAEPGEHEDTLALHPTTALCVIQLIPCHYTAASRVLYLFAGHL